MNQTVCGAADGYRFGFNGQEKDNELYGEGNAYSFEYRVHDPRLGRFLSVDPLSAGYPSSSPYCFAQNRCIDGVDLEGKEWIKYDEFLKQLNILQQKHPDLNLTEEGLLMAQGLISRTMVKNGFGLDVIYTLMVKELFPIPNKLDLIE